MTAVAATTTVSDGDLMAIGATLLNVVVTVRQLQHASPASSLDYMTSLDSDAGHIVRDFIAWTSGRKGLAPGCEDRLIGYVDQSGWTRHRMDVAFADIIPT